MNDHVRLVSADSTGERPRVQKIDGVDDRVAAMDWGAVQALDVMAAGEKGCGEMRPDEPGCACDENPYPMSLMYSRVSSGTRP